MWAGDLSVVRMTHTYREREGERESYSLLSAIYTQICRQCTKLIHVMDAKLFWNQYHAQTNNWLSYVKLNPSQRKIYVRIFKSLNHKERNGAGLPHILNPNLTL